MTHSTAIVQTEHASRYLQQLCKHWSHKMTVHFDPAQGRVEFPSGATLAMKADAAALTLRLESDDAEGLPRLQTVVEDHIKRFAFREKLDFAWDGQPD